jgi:hypothetical protein
MSLARFVLVSDSGIVREDPPVSPMTFTTTGATFAPLLTVDAGADVLWTYPGGTSSEVNPSIDFGSPGEREVTLRVTPWSALTMINVGNDGADGGSIEWGIVPNQNVTGVTDLSLAADSLVVFCASYNPLVSLDLSGMASVETVECYQCHSLSSVVLTGATSLRRLCVEECLLTSLDLSGAVALEDLRGALNQWTSILWADEYPALWHICVRQSGLPDGYFADMTMFPVIRDLYIWDTGQTGTLRLATTGAYSEILAADNSYSSLDLAGALQNPASYAIVNLSGNALTTVDVSGCAQITSLNLSNNSLDETQVDGVLSSLDAAGREGAPLVLDLSGNAAPSLAGLVSVSSLEAKGWTVTVAA